MFHIGHDSKYKLIHMYNLRTLSKVELRLEIDC